MSSEQADDKSDGGTSDQGESAIGSGDGTRTASEVLADEENQGLVKYLVGVFAIIGVGFGLTGAFGVRLLTDGESAEVGAAFLALTVFGVMFFSGPILGAIAGLRVGDSIEEVREAAITAAAGGFVGYIVMVVLAVILAVLFFPSGDGGGGGGGSPFQLGDVLVPLIVMAIPVAVVAAGVVYVESRLV